VAEVLPPPPSARVFQVSEKRSRLDGRHRTTPRSFMLLERLAIVPNVSSAAAVAFCAMAISCAPRPTPTSETPDTPPSGAADAGGEGSREAANPEGSGEAQVSFFDVPRLDGLPMLEEARHSRDPANLYATHAQEPIRGFRKRPRAPGGLARLQFTKALAFRFNLDHGDVLDGHVGGCTDVAVAQDGTFCPSVSTKSVELSKPRARALLSSLPTVRAPLKEVRAGGYYPTVAVVYLDRKGAPIAEIDLCYGCEKWHSWPAIDGFYDRTGGIAMSDALSEAARGLCSEVGFPECAPDEAARWQAEVEKAAVQNADLHELTGGYGLWFLAGLRTGLPVETPLASLTPEQKKAACAVHAQEAHAYGLRPDGEYECDGGSQFRVLSWLGCANAFPTCDRPIGEVEKCVRARYSDPCLVAAEVRACRELASCQWGFGR
jgi:hypothetical protein